VAKTGRPIEGDAPKLAPLNMRTSPQLREQIERAADINGRSLTQEVERRLVTSFIFDEVRGGPHIGSLANMICATIQMIEQGTGHRWMDDFDTFTMVRAAMERLLAWKNPGADLRDEVKLLKEQERTGNLATKARADLLEFRSAKGLMPVGVGVLMWPEHVGKSDADFKTRKDWTDDDFNEEARLEAIAEQARETADAARRAHDEWMATAYARMDQLEERGAGIANAVFQEQGPRG
jgi:hypothetical protein